MLDLQEIKRQFADRLKVLGAKVDEIEEDLREPSDPDFAEQATEAEGDEVLEGLRRFRGRLPAEERLSRDAAHER